MKRTSFVWIVILLSHYLSGGVVVTGNDTAAPKAFKTPVSAQTFDRKTGTFFVGLESGTDAYTLSKAPRPTFTTIPSFQSILKAASTLTSATIEFLKFSPQSSGLDVLTAVPRGSSDFTATTVTSLFTDGNPSPEVVSSNLNDASGLVVTNGIVQIETDNNNIYAAVGPNDSFFGDLGTGIALIGLGVSGSTITLDIKDATTGNTGNKAAPLNRDSTVIKGTSGGLDVIFTNTFAALHWDEDLERLFIGFNLKSDSTSTDIAKAVVVGRLDSGILNFQAIAPDAAISGGGVDEIVVTEGAHNAMSPHHLRVMHVSTGPDYLIVDCSVTNVGPDCAFTPTCNRVFALPLVNDTANPTDADNGTIADKASALASTKKFTDPATLPGDLPENNAITDPEAVVGAGDLPLESTQTISDMVVVGDAVYVSISRSPSSTNDSGIWVSQALFDDTGKIIRWTPWTAKRIVPLNAFPGITLPGGSTHSGSIKFLEVDGRTGNIWFVEADTGQTVGITSWSTGLQSTDLITNVRAALSDSSYAVLDLNQTTRGFLDTTPQRYALFGGVKKVIFARTATATDTSDPASPQTAITDYSSGENFLITSLPDTAGCCNVLEYTRTSTTADNDSTRTDFGFFFAGTDNGLYAFSDGDGNGFDAIDLALLNAAPFDTFTWRKVANIEGKVVDIKTSGAGRTLYVITSQSSAAQPFIGTVFSVPFANNIVDMFASANIRTIGQTGVGIFSNVLQFYGLEIVATADPRAANPENKEQLVLTTNQGLFHSDASQGASSNVATAVIQADANWQLIVKDALNTTANTLFNGINGMDTPVRNTTWPFSVQDQSGFNTFDRGTIHQYSAIGDSGGTDATFATFFDPEKFNANTTLTAFKTLDLINYFFSDGGRRFFIFNRTTDPADESKLAIIPYNVADWNVTLPTILNNPIVENVRRFYWVRLIGPTGILLAGTNKGVIGLQ